MLRARQIKSLVMRCREINALCARFRPEKTLIAGQIYHWSTETHTHT